MRDSAAARVKAPPIRRARASWRVRETLYAYVYLLPTIIGLLLFSAGAVIMSLGISFTRWEGETRICDLTWVGFGNYVKAFTDPLFPQVVWNTCYYVLGFVPINLVIGLFLALLVNQELKGVTLFRALFFLPVITSGVAVALIFTWLLSAEFGPVNELLWKLFRIRGPRWLATTEWAMPSLILLGIWKGVGYTMVIYLAGLQGIDVTLYEAARIDGANSWQLFAKITVPMLTPTTFFLLITSIIGSFQVFVPTYVMTKGGPLHATTTLPYWIYQNAFEWFHMSYAAALAYVLFIVILTLTLIQWRMQRRWVFYQ